MKRNYQQEMQGKIEELIKKDEVPTLLLHSCCAPCSSYVLEYLSDFFYITVLYYNPNIFPKEEYDKRLEEQQSLIRQLPAKYPISFLGIPYEEQSFYQAVKGYEEIPEGGERCMRCFRLRLEKAVLVAKEQGCDFVTTTLSISPLKNAEKLNEIGEELGIRYGVAYLTSDFKKRGGYQRSVELSKKYNLYRQDYCGCVFSKKEKYATLEGNAIEKK